MNLAMIWAQGRNGAIGAGGAIPWRVPEDMALFKRATLGCPVIMGRKTWDSLPPRFRPLPSRTNIVVSRDAAFRAEGAVLVSSADDAAAAASESCGNRGLAWVMGGAQIYGLFLDRADTLLVTEVDVEVPDADAFAPQIAPADWQLREETEWRVSSGGPRYRFHLYARHGKEAPIPEGLLTGSSTPSAERQTEQNPGTR